MQKSSVSCAHRMSDDKSFVTGRSSREDRIVLLTSSSRRTMSLQIDSAAGSHPGQGAAHRDQSLGGRALAGTVLRGLRSRTRPRRLTWARKMLDGVRNLVLQVAATPGSEPKRAIHGGRRGYQPVPSHRIEAIEAVTRI
jgi:hypothetical protein